MVNTMPYYQNQSSKFEKLRQNAERLIQTQPGLSSPPPTDILDLIHDLKIHQAELEIQNEELQRAQEELSILHREYEDLYEFAPCGYVTLNNKGIVIHANLAATTLLQTPRYALTNSAFSNYIHADYTDVMISTRKKAGETGNEQSGELMLKTEKGKPILCVTILNKKSLNDINGVPVRALIRARVI